MSAGGSPVTQALIYLAAMLVSVPLARRFGLGAVLGYLAAGALLGPSALGLLGGGANDVSHLAEFGVIMMLFVIGLELRPALLWKLRGPIFGLGSLQVALTAAAIAGCALALGLAPKAAVALGGILALSSTAIALQSLQESGKAKTSGGEATFAVLLFQDIAVIPMLALFPLLAGRAAPTGAEGSGAAHGAATWLADPWARALAVVLAVGLVVGVGRWLLRPVFRAVARASLRELFTALALLLVLATTALMQLVGLSPALGAFLAGVVLADSEYRHQLEVDIAPFKGLLLGLFFISVGAGIDFGIVAARPAAVLGAVTLLIVGKGALLLGLGRFARLSAPDRGLFAVSLAQGGEFAFVLAALALSLGILDRATGQFVSAVVALSMPVAPLLMIAYLRWVEPRLGPAARPAREADRVGEADAHVIVAGFGRFGQTVTRLLRSTGFRATVLDFDADQVEMLRKFGQHSYFGDAQDMDLLRSAGIETARILALAIDDAKATSAIVERVKLEYPRVRILARAYDRVHAYELLNQGVDEIYIETSGSALSMGTEALKLLGFGARRAHRAAQVFRGMNNRSIRELAKAYRDDAVDEQGFIAQSRGWTDALEKMLLADAADHAVAGGPFGADRGWETAARAQSADGARPLADA